MSLMHSLALHKWDVVTGMMRGAARNVPPYPDATAERPPRACFESAVLGALRRPPCLISFSGGRDSSAVLAVAAAVARREGLPLPVPATLRFPSAVEADESEWQELVVRHLDIQDWVRIEVGDEHGFLGPVARQVLSKHGLLWPANTHMHRPMLEHARGGTLMTGIDGDGLFGTWSWLRPRGTRREKSLGYARRRVVGALPRPLRRFVLQRHAYTPPWVRPGARTALALFRADSWSTEPWHWEERLRWYWHRRHLWGLRRSMAQLAADVDVQVVHPLLDPDFLAALGAAGGRGGLGDRTAIMRHLFDDLLPDVLLARDSQAFFDDVFWTTETRAFAADVDRTAHPELVDTGRVRAEWLRPVPNFGSALLLQATWLNERALAMA